MLLSPGHVFTLLGTILQLACCHQQLKPLSSHTPSASPVPANQVYILGSSRTGIAVISTALQTLGYKQIPPGDLPISSRDPTPNQGTFSLLSVELGIEKYSIMSPGAKFILLVDNTMRIECPNEERFGAEQGYPKEYQNCARPVQDYFIQSGQDASLLEFHITSNSDRMADDWPKLCQFLGLGYSVVERYHLRQFPEG